MDIRRLFKKDEAPRCSVVIVAAGRSERMGRDKIMGSLRGLPVIVRTVRAFERSPLVDEIIIVTGADKIEHMAMLCRKYELGKVSKVICGGKTRMESALAGVSEVKSRARLIAIHDGARPLVSQTLIHKVVYAAADNNAAAPVIRSADSLKLVDDKGGISGTVDRESVVRVQTPQVFCAELIKGALTKAVTDGLSITDDCAAMELMGVKVRAVPGEESNIKLTTAQDMLLAEAILRNRGE